MGEQVCAVVVTYNRKLLLRECLNALSMQTRRPDAILVVDNASTDDTLALVATEFPHVQRLPLNDNGGSAGGFNAGMRWAYQHSFDWIWIMDDDGRPAPTCLELLIECAQILPNTVVGPLCVRSDSPSLLSFPMPTTNHEYGSSTYQVKDVQTNAGTTGIMMGWACFFNGLLFSRDVITTIGLPRAEMFIWGDEAEYFKRTKKFGCKLATVVEALHYHPADKVEWRSIFGRRFQVYAGKLDWKAYCFFRNQGLIAKLYGRLFGLSTLLRYLIYFLIYKRLDLASLSFFLKAYFAGMRGDFSKRVPY